MRSTAHLLDSTLFFPRGSLLPKESLSNLERGPTRGRSILSRSFISISTCSTPKRPQARKARLLSPLSRRGVACLAACLAAHHGWHRRRCVASVAIPRTLGYKLHLRRGLPWALNYSLAPRPAGFHGPSTPAAFAPQASSKPRLPAAFAPQASADPSHERWSRECECEWAALSTNVLSDGGGLGGRSTTILLDRQDQVRSAGFRCPTSSRPLSTCVAASQTLSPLLFSPPHATFVPRVNLRCPLPPAQVAHSGSSSRLRPPLGGQLSRSHCCDHCRAAARRAGARAHCRIILSSRRCPAALGRSSLGRKRRGRTQCARMRRARMRRARTRPVASASLASGAWHRV